MSHALSHPVATFVYGLIVAIAILVLVVSCSAPANHSAEEIAAYKRVLADTGKNISPENKEAVERFTGFLQGIGSQDFIIRNTPLVYAEDAYLNDTLVTKRGVPEIQAYFLETSKAMKSYQVTIDDVSRSGPDYYIRWTMIVAAPALSKGTPVHSTGISQVRFNDAGKVTVHQDYWDSGKHFFGKLPVAGSVIEFIRRKLQ